MTSESFMTTFDDRENAYEDAFKRDEEAKFKIRAKRDHLFGDWIAAMLSLDGKEADDYGLSYVVEDLKHPGDEDVTDKAIADLGAKGIEITVEELNQQLLVFFRDAQKVYKKEIGAR